MYIRIHTLGGSDSDSLRGVTELVVRRYDLGDRACYPQWIVVFEETVRTFLVVAGSSRHGGVFARPGCGRRRGQEGAVVESAGGLQVGVLLLLAVTGTQRNPDA